MNTTKFYKRKFQERDEKKLWEHYKERDPLMVGLLIALRQCSQSGFVCFMDELWDSTEDTNE